MWAYVYDHYRDDYDFFHICGDDVYTAVDNLRAFLDGPQVMRLENGYMDKITKRHRIRHPGARPRPLILGAPMTHKKCLLAAGGPGYTLNRAALVLFAEDGLPSFLPEAIDAREDVFLGSFFCELGHYVSDTSDNKCSFRYNHADAQTQYDFKGRSPTNIKYIKSFANIDYKQGIDSVSQQTIGFHLKIDLLSDEDAAKKLVQKGQGLKKKAAFWKEQRQLHEFRKMVGHNYTVADLMYRYHAILHDWC